MAITATNLASGTTPAPGSTLSTSSVSPAVGSLVIVTVAAQSLVDAFVADPIKVSGAGIIFRKVASVEPSATAYDMTVWVGVAQYSQSGPINIEWLPPTSYSELCWSVDEIQGAHVANNGADAVVQSLVDTNGVATSISQTMAAYASPDNAGFAAYIWNQFTGPAVSATPQTGWTELAEQQMGVGGDALALEVQFTATPNTTASVTWSSAGMDLGAVALELKAFVPSGGALAWSTA